MNSSIFRIRGKKEKKNGKLRKNETAKDETKGKFVEESRHAFQRKEWRKKHILRQKKKKLCL